MSQREKPKDKKVSLFAFTPTYSCIPPLIENADELLIIRHLYSTCKEHSYYFREN
ncbi:MAG: hypothetical protein K0S44_77 [Bacteroidetes bacterium]|nr:hypothetical protein [Bacteroidota bacterium]